MKTITKEQLLARLTQFAHQRPGLEFGNYGDVSSYRSEMRSITKDLHIARSLIRAVEWRDGITVENLLNALRHNYSGRLSYDAEKDRLDYCTGQYFPTEYRKAVCAVLAGALWDYMRDCIPTDVESKGDWLREYFRREFGRGIADRYFN